MKSAYSKEEKFLIQSDTVLSKVIKNNGHISFSNKMLNWPKGSRKTDGVWSTYWYKNVIKSSSFKPYKKSNESLPKEYNNLLEECLQCYDYLNSFKNY